MPDPVPAGERPDVMAGGREYAGYYLRGRESIAEDAGGIALHFRAGADWYKGEIKADPVAPSQSVERERTNILYAIEHGHADVADVDALIEAVRREQADRIAELE